MQALEILTPFWYTPEGEQGKAQPTRFQLRGLSGIEFMEVAVHIRVRDNGDVVLTPEAVRAVMTHGLLGWERFYDSNGPVLFVGNPSLNMQRIPRDVLQDMALECLEHTEMGVDAQKKSSPTSRSDETPKTSTAEPVNGVDTVTSPIPPQ